MTPANEGRSAGLRRRRSSASTPGVPVNPFFVYVVVFGAALLLYHLPWSGLYPQISPALWVFFLATFCIATFLGLGLTRSIERTLVRKRSVDIPTPWYFFLSVSYLLEYLHAGGIPIVWVASGQQFIYEDFGVPTLHVFVMTFGAFLSVVNYNAHLNTTGTRSYTALTWTFLPVVYDVTIVSRGFVLLNLTSCFFVYFLNRKFTALRLVSLMAGVGALLLMFAFLGDLRTASRNEQEFVENVILNIGDATPSFRESSVPPATFWAYLYATSPLANLQKTIDTPGQRAAPEDVVQFVISELVPDFVSKRIFDLMGAERRHPTLITPALTVATLFASSYAYLGWLGMCVTFVVLCATIYLYVASLRMNHFSVPALAMANTFIVFCIFDNMIYFSGMSLQLIWPLLLSLGHGGWNMATKQSSLRRSAWAHGAR